MSKIDDDGFCVVNSKRSAKKNIKLPGFNCDKKSNYVFIDIDRAKGKILAAQEDVASSSYFHNFIEAVSKCLASNSAVEIVSFGLGHIAECTIARYQFALLLCLRDILNVKILVHDPIFYKEECELLRKFDIIIIPDNEEGKYKISQDGRTIVYLPHCPKQLTNNFIWFNWGEQLKHCILICNSFSRLIENNSDRIVAEAVPNIFKIYPYISEITLENNFKFTDIFNDTSVHIFPEEKLRALPSPFWNKGDSPKYEDATEFITSLMIERLTL